MGKKKKGRSNSNNNSQQHKQKNKKAKAALSAEEQKLRKRVEEFDTGSNPYTNTLNKRIRNVNKKLAKIKSLRDKTPEELNDDQKQSIAREAELVAELERFQTIQLDLVKISLEATSAHPPLEEEAVDSFDIGLGRLCKLNAITRLPCFEWENEQAGQLVADLASNSLLGFEITEQVLQKVKDFSRLLGGYANDPNDSIAAVIARTTELTTKYAQLSDEVAPRVNLTFRQINTLIDVIEQRVTSQA